MARKARRREQGTGSVRQLPSGRWQARWRDGEGKLHPAPQTFDTRLDAAAWLDGAEPGEAEAERSDPRLADYAETWLTNRPLKTRTRQHYRRLLDRFVLPAPIADQRLTRITPARVRAWYDALDDSTPTQRSHVYLLLHAILQDAWREDLIASNPARIRGAGTATRRSQTRIATPGEVEAIAAAMPERYRALVVFSAWCALRFGEATELRRCDVDLTAGAVHIRRAVVRLGGRFEVTSPKSDAGRRTVAVPPHVLPVLADHLAEHVEPGQDALLWPAAGDPSRHLAPATLFKVFYPAREKAGRPDLRWHDLRHTGAVYAALAGASLAELMARLGHRTASAALRYQHAAEGRDAALAAAMSAALVEKGGQSTTT